VIFAHTGGTCDENGAELGEIYTSEISRQRALRAKSITKSNGLLSSTEH
jgi:hypothetical protein